MMKIKLMLMILIHFMLYSITSVIKTNLLISNKINT